MESKIKWTELKLGTNVSHLGYELDPNFSFI